MTCTLGSAARAPAADPCKARGEPDVDPAAITAYRLGGETEEAR